MHVNKYSDADGNPVLFQKSLYYTFFYGIISFVLVLVALLLLYVTCSRRYKLNWFEKNLLERANNVDALRSENEVASVTTEYELGSNRSISNIAGENKFWAALNHAWSSSSVNEGTINNSNKFYTTFPEKPKKKTSTKWTEERKQIRSHRMKESEGRRKKEKAEPKSMVPRECGVGHFESRNSIASNPGEDNTDNEAKPIARSDKEIVLCTTKPARPRVCSMNTKLDHTKIDSTFYQEVSRSPSVDVTGGSVNISLSYDQAAGILSVRLIQAKDLLPRDFSGTSDPYAKIRLLPDVKNVWQTRIHKKTINPVFDEDFVFEVPSASLDRRTLEIILYDFDAFSRHLSLGEVRLPLSEFDLQEKVTLWRALEPCSEPHKKVELGDLLVTLSFLQSAERLTIVVNKARNLRVVDDTRLSSDPFVKVSLIQDGKKVKKKKTSVQRNDLNPVFNESVTFDIPKENLPNISVEFSVYHDSKFGQDEFLGKAAVGLGSNSQPEEVKLFKELLGSKAAVSKWLTLRDTQ